MFTAALVLCLEIDIFCFTTYPFMQVKIFLNIVEN